MWWRIVCRSVFKERFSIPATHHMLIPKVTSFCGRRQTTKNVQVTSSCDICFVDYEYYPENDICSLLLVDERVAIGFESFKLKNSLQYCSFLSCMLFALTETNMQIMVASYKYEALSFFNISVCPGNT